MQTMPHGTGASPTAVQDPFDTPPVQTVAEPIVLAEHRGSKIQWWHLAIGAVVVIAGGAVVGNRYVDHKVNSVAAETASISASIIDADAAATRGDNTEAVAKLASLAKSTLGDNSISLDTRATIVDALLVQMVESPSSTDLSKVMPELLKTVDDRLPQLGSRQELLGWYYLYTGDADLSAARFRKAASLYDQHLQPRQSGAAQVGLALTEMIKDEPKLDKAVGSLQNAIATAPGTFSVAGFGTYLGTVDADPKLARLARTSPVFRANAALVLTKLK